MICARCGREYGDWELACPACGSVAVDSLTLERQAAPGTEPPVGAEWDAGNVCPACGGLVGEWDYRCPHCDVELFREESSLRAAKARGFRRKKGRRLAWLLLLLIPVIAAALLIPLCLKAPQVAAPTRVGRPSRSPVELPQPSPLLTPTMAAA